MKKHHLAILVALYGSADAAAAFNAHHYFPLLLDVIGVILMVNLYARETKPQTV